MHTPRIVRSIWITVLALFAFQAALVVTVGIAWRIDWTGVIWYVVVMPTMHVALGIILASLSRLFVIVDTGEQLTRVNLPNLLSMIRVSSAPTILLFVLLADSYSVVPVLVPLTALVFLTDLLDGQISRRTHQTTRIGKFLDSSSDYTVLFISSVALVSYHLISTWFFVVVLLRFGLQLVGQIILFLVQRMKIQFRTSFLGKASVFLVMTLFALALLRLVGGMPAWYETAYAVAEYVTAAVAIVSLGEKTFLFTVDARNAAKRSRSRTGS